MVQGVAVYDTMQYVTGDVFTIGVGLNASMGAFLLHGGTFTKRVMTQNTSIMIHQPHMSPYDRRATSIESSFDSEYLGLLRSYVARTYLRRTKQDFELICYLLERDIYMTPDQAVEFGLIDEIGVEGLGFSDTLDTLFIHDDADAHDNSFANRALMGSNMQRQAVPLVQPEKCIVGTGLEGQAALDSGSVAIAKQGGKIKYIDGENITITSSVARNNIETELILYQRSNSDTCMHQKPRVRQGEYVKRGQIIADSAATAGGELSLGKNILVAYMPWEGYNFEDAILISERLVYQDIFTSFQIVRYEIGVYFTNQGPEVITREIPHLDAYLLRHLDENGLVMIGSWIETGDVLVGKLILEAEEDSLLNTPEGKLLQALFDIKAPTGKENCFRVPKGVKGRVIDVRCFQEFEEDDYLGDIVEKVHVYILQKRKIQVGDKVAGRHGNKGIISKILPRQDMPYLQNGTPVDMVLNPLGVPSRMNVGQIFECLLGLAGKLMNKHYRLAPFDERYEREASRKLVFSELYKASEQTANPWVFEPDHPGKHRLIDGRTGKVFEQPVTIGIAYISKLCHQVDDKIHARSSGPYTLVTQQPLKGKSHRGGQRVGEMEVWALQGFGVAYILHEMLTLKSDHMDTREKIFGAIFNGEPMPKPSTPTESFRLLSRELRSLALELNHTILSEIDFQIDKKEV
ncbi:DNA-directed RNA polymerase subunit beta-like [Cryptomeria japonica]|uniref:DNA-directed RNA polymerase subunit beta-like n=1 Tax=Cryptomeria japonica TaxID=3369 RepID=UPI0027DA5A5D|nr:DNA-directed RNA polymerase subunit beta-like [Cryptomeria japonica]